MLKLIAALSILAAAPASPETAPDDWSAGWEAGYLAACAVSPEERAAWASPVPLVAADPATFLEGYHAALDEVADYERAGFDFVEWCADVRP